MITPHWPYKTYRTKLKHCWNMITTDIKNKIIDAIKANRANYPSDAKHASSLGITTSVYSAVKNGQTDRVLSDANWISIARKLGVSLRGEIEWKVAKTPTFMFITAQLEVEKSVQIDPCRRKNVTLFVEIRLTLGDEIKMTPVGILRRGFFL